MTWHLSLRHNMGCDHTIPMGLPHQRQGHVREKARKRLPRRGYTFERAGLMSAAKSTLSDDVHHRMLPPWGLYFF